MGRVRISTVCPKCQRERRPDEQACARCGLLVSRWESFVTEPLEHPAVDAAWATLREHWEDSAAHRAFLEAASVADALDVAAARYRDELRAHPSSSRAQRGLKRAEALAVNLHAQRSLGDRVSMSSPTLRTALKILAVLVAMAVILAILDIVRFYLNWH
jgi:hypothetical protein